MTLKQKLIAAMLTGVIIMAVVLTLIFGNAFYKYGRQQTYTKTQIAAVAIDKTIKEWLDARHDILSAAALLLGTNVDKAVLAQAANSSDFDSVYVGLSNGEMHMNRPVQLPDGYDPRTREWYLSAANSNAPIVSEAYFDAASGQPMITLALAIRRQGRVVGVLAGDLTLDVFSKEISAISLGKNANTMIVEDDLIIVHANEQLIKQPLTRLSSDLTRNAIQTTQQAGEFLHAQAATGEKVVYFHDVPNTRWKLAFELDLATEMAELKNSLIRIIVVGLLITTLVAGVTSYIISYLFKDLMQVSSALQTIAQGEGDLTQRLDPRNDDEVGQLAHNFNLFVGHMHGMVMRMRSIAEQLSSQSAQAATQAQQRSVSIQQQQDEVTSVATAIDQMAATTQEVASNAEDTARTSHRSVSLSNDGAGQVRQSQQSVTTLASEVDMATNVINALDEHTQNINNILATIQGIAEQTNLLALNAAIEAARAGSQGRGFAVVADEVRVLSQRTHDSTAEIQSTIETLQRVTAEAVGLMTDSRQLAETSVQDANQAADSLSQITAAINEISDMATQIASAAEEQSLVTQEITRNTHSIRSVSDEMAGEAKEAAAQAQALSALANDLQTEVVKFKV